MLAIPAHGLFDVPLVSRPQADDATEGGQLRHQGNSRIINPSIVDADWIARKPLKNRHAGYRVVNIWSQSSQYSIQSKEGTSISPICMTCVRLPAVTLLPHRPQGRASVRPTMRQPQHHRDDPEADNNLSFGPAELSGPSGTINWWRNMTKFRPLMGVAFAGQSK